MYLKKLFSALFIFLFIFSTGLLAQDSGLSPNEIKEYQELSKEIDQTATENEIEVEKANRLITLLAKMNQAQKETYLGTTPNSTEQRDFTKKIVFFSEDKSISADLAAKIMNDPNNPPRTVRKEKDEVIEWRLYRE